MPNLQEATDKYLAAIRAKVEKPVLLDLGCGQNPAQGFTGVDISGKADQLVDLYKYPWPWENESVDYFRACHFVEHVPDWDRHFGEVYRCLKAGGLYEIISPYYMNARFWQDPDHKQPILRERFAYLSKEWRELVKMDHRYDGAGVNFVFDDTDWFELLHPDFLNKGFDDEYIRWHATHSWNVVDDVALILKKVPL